MTSDKQHQPHPHNQHNQQHQQQHHHHLQACDNCRSRKIKCDRGSPCRNCVDTELHCQYLHVIRRRGPRRGVGRRLAQLRQGSTSLDKDYFDVITLDSPTQPAGDDCSRPGAEPDASQPPSTTSLPAAAAAAAAIDRHDAAVQPPESFRGSPPTLEPFTPIVGAQSPQLCLSLVAHVHVFLKYLYPIMPAVDGEQLLADAIRLDTLSPSRYALIISLCAATRIQLKLDNVENSIGHGPGADIPIEPRLTGEGLLNLAENSLRQFSVIDDYTMDSILASFFIFAGYGNLNNIRRAWFYLNQSITLAQSLDITSENGYINLTESEREARRRVFWLLFVTERTFALQHRRSVMLRGRVEKPRVVDSDSPVVMNDFINHVRLFDLLPASLYEWHTQNDGGRSGTVSLADKINQSLCTIQPANSVIESQRFDTLLTQQWLRVSMWRLAFGTKPSMAYNTGMLLSHALPLDAGRIVMEGLETVGQSSKDCHGIGMEQKLFDIGISVTDSALMAGAGYSAIEAGPRDLLCSIVKCLSRIRGCESHLLPKLLKHSESILGRVDPAAHIDTPWAMCSNQGSYGDRSVGNRSPSDVSEQASAMNWTLMEEIGFIDADASCLPFVAESIGAERVSPA